MEFCVPHGGDGADRLDHMADHVDDGQVDDGPVGNKQSLDAADWQGFFFFSLRKPR